MTRHYTADPYGNIAVPNLAAGFMAGYADKLPKTLGNGAVRREARDLADSVISDARTLHGPVVWLTGNSYMPPMRSFPAAEEVWNAANNDDGELFAWFAELVEGYLSEAGVLLECADYDNALYAVDLKRWQYRELSSAGQAEAANDDINYEWEPVDPYAVDDNAENPRE